MLVYRCKNGTQKGGRGKKKEKKKKKARDSRVSLKRHSIEDQQHLFPNLFLSSPAAKMEARGEEKRKEKKGKRGGSYLRFDLLTSQKLCRDMLTPL